MIYVVFAGIYWILFFWVQSPKNLKGILILGQHNRHQSQTLVRETTDGETFAFPSSWREQATRCFAFICMCLLVIWRYGSLSRTKSQGQISWLCSDNSWEEQTRKSLHFIKDPAGEQQSFSSFPPTLSIAAILPSVCHYMHNSHFHSPVLVSSN